MNFMHNKTILIVEDNFLNRRISKNILSQNGYTILEAKNTSEATLLLNQGNVDFIILDINLGENERNGISFGKEIFDRYKIPFLYLTAYDNIDVMSKAIETIPYSYITKPFKNSDLLAAVELGIRQSNQHTPKKTTIIVKEDDYRIEIEIRDIYYIEADKNYLNIHTVDKVYTTRATIKQITTRLPQSCFIQTHRAYIVNKNKIEKFNLKFIVVKNNEIPISKNFIECSSILMK